MTTAELEAYATVAGVIVNSLVVAVALGSVIITSFSDRRRREELAQQCRYAAQVGHMEIGAIPPLLDPSHMLKVDEVEAQIKRLDDVSNVLTALLRREVPAAIVFGLVEMRRLVTRGTLILDNSKMVLGAADRSAAVSPYFQQSMLLLGLSDAAVNRFGVLRTIETPVVVRAEDLRRAMMSQGIADHCDELAEED